MKKLGRLATAPQLVDWNRETAGISADIECVETQAHLGNLHWRTVAGAALAAVWAAHRSVLLNVDDCAKIIGESIKGAYRLYEAMRKLESFMAVKMTIRLILLTQPNVNFVVYVSIAAKNKSHQYAAIAVSYSFHLGFTYEYARTPETASRHI